MAIRLKQEEEERAKRDAEIRAEEERKLLKRKSRNNDERRSAARGSTLFSGHYQQGKLFEHNVLVLYMFLLFFKVDASINYTIRSTTIKSLFVF